MEFVKTGVVICTRLDSHRVPNKAVAKINNVPMIKHLVNRLKSLPYPIVIACPRRDINIYQHVLDGIENVFFYEGYPDDPLARIYHAAKEYELETVIRITHDKIFVRQRDIINAVAFMETEKADYVFGSKFIPGSGFEVISTSLLGECTAKWKDIEFLGYAARTLSKNTKEFNPRHPVGDYRLLVDYAEDIKLIELVCAMLGNDCELDDVIPYLNTNPHLKKINQLPQLTVYTCAYNAKEFIDQAMRSVENQTIFKSIEYIIIDDCSTDGTIENVAAFALKHPNVKWIRNQTNKGLASSSNVALKEARGEFIMRLDADDWFSSINSLETMLNEIRRSGKEAIYPDNYFGSFDNIQDGGRHFHIGGAIFCRRAINHVKFTDGLRNYDSLDVWARAKDQLKIGFLKKPIFFYRQHANNMSKTNLEERAKIKKKIIANYMDPLEVEEYAEV